MVVRRGKSSRMSIVLNRKVCACVTFGVVVLSLISSFLMLDANAMERSSLRTAAKVPPEPLREKVVRASTDRELKCARQEAWLDRARRDLPSKFASESLDAHLHSMRCHTATHVCLKGNALVHRGPESESDTVDEFHPPIPLESSGFHMFNHTTSIDLPGYHPSFGWWVRRTQQPIHLRIVAGDEKDEDLRHAKSIKDVVPVIMFSDFPTSFGATFRRMFSWIIFYEASLVHNQPLIVPVLWRLKLPDFWRLWEPLVPRIEEFDVLSYSCETREPLCFRQVAGCKIDESWGMSSSALNPKRYWPVALARVVRHWCPAEAFAVRSKQNPFVIAFGQRTLYRLIRNLPEIVQACNGTVVNGRRFHCKEIVFTSPLKDVCWLQSVDILVSVHGSQVANAFYMRPGTAMIEVKASVSPDITNRVNVHWRQAWLTNSTFYWMYEVGSRHRFSSVSPTVDEIDSDVELDWGVLKCLLTTIITVDSDRARYEALRRYSSNDCVERS
eukprot:TRINITY_DN64724_c0_g1_i1.p1 TRINITY_DN64724_c0_g1~~TRINITY_DN64724_c0_g1_i1.p1  ORF type:complete len:499 (+),score=44.17 TRINITY_DN64724_c0_g1_i1:54-1550(+)